MRDVLVHVTRFDAWSNSLRYAGQLAGLLKASLSGLYCMEPKAPAIGSSAEGMATAGVPGPDSDIESARAADASFGCYVASLGVKHSTWMVHPGSAAKALPHLAHWHDLVVLGADASAPHMEPVLSELLLDARLPCLVVPEAWTSRLRPARIAVAWDGSIPALRALHAAIPLLERAHRVVLLIGGAHGPLSLAPHLPTFDLDRYCERHDLNVERVALDPPERQTGATLLSAALAANVELLVMGAYGHARASERLFGGVTRSMLQHSGIPLLLRH